MDSLGWTYLLQLSALCKVITEAGFEARLEGEDRQVASVNTLEDAKADQLSFLTNPKYAAALAGTDASAVLVHDDVSVPDGVSAVRCSDPYAGVTVAIVALHGYRRHPVWGISPQASIDPTATIGAGANIAAGATVAANATVGQKATFYPGVYIGEGVTIGDECVLFPNVVIYDDCILGDRVTIHAGTVIGEDGLGYAPHGDTWIKIPQIGRAVLGDDVEIGANCAIDRATLGQTEIGSGSKFGNGVIIGHGSKIGPNCLFVGQVGVAGSVTVGKHVTLAGQVGVAGHLSIGDHARAAGRSGIANSIKEGADVFGSPAVDMALAKRMYMAVQKLPEWVKRIRALEREVKALHEQLGRSE